MKIRFLVGAALLGCALVAQADCPSTPGRFIGLGDQVQDVKTGLVWARCAVGQRWDGETCSGAATTFTFQGATESAERTEGWRLPTMPELYSLIDQGCSYPAIDSKAFPNTPRNWFWTSSDFVWAREGSLWVIHFAQGTGDGFYRGYDHLVARLVRDPH